MNGYRSKLERRRVSPASFFKASLDTLTVTSLTGHTTACAANTVKSCKQRENGNLHRHHRTLWSSVWYSLSCIKIFFFLNKSLMLRLGLKYMCARPFVVGEVGCDSSLHAFCRLMSSFLFSMQSTQVWKCVLISLTLMRVSGFDRKTTKTNEQA